MLLGDKLKAQETEYYDNGNILFEKVTDKILNYVYVVYYDNGSKKAITYQKGKTNMIEEFYDNGQLKAKGAFGFVYFDDDNFLGKLNYVQTLKLDVFENNLTAHQ